MERTHQPRLRGYHWHTAIIAIAFLIFFVFMTMKFLKQISVANDQAIAEHVQQLQGIFKQINESCKIVGFRSTKNQINFLNVISFAGSILGPMALAEPKNWKGPYMQENPESEGRNYQIVVTKSGDYILPGDGVKLSNGKVIGKTLVLNAKSDIEAMMLDPKALLSGTRPLAARIEVNQRKPIRESYNDTLAEEIEASY